MNFNSAEVSAVHTKMLEILQQHKLTVGELIILYGNLGYSIGASIKGILDSGPSVDELKQLYYTDPKDPGIALMMQGYLTTTWFDTLKKLEEEQQPTKETQ